MSEPTPIRENHNAQDQAVENAMRLGVDDPPQAMSANLWNRIEAQIASPPKRRMVEFRLLLPLAAALVILSLGAGLLIGRTMDSPANDPDTVPVVMADEDYAPEGTLVYLPDQHVFVVDATRIPAAPEGKVYQVWFERNGRTLSAGTIEPGADTFAFSIDRSSIDRLYVSIEPGTTGSEQPTSPPMAEAVLGD